MNQTANLVDTADHGRATLDARATLTTVTVVGEPASSSAYHALREELGWLGFHARHAPVTGLRANASPVVAIGAPALDGGAALRAALGPRAAILVVLSEDQLEARLAAYRVGARPIPSGDEASIAAGVVSAIADAPPPVGWCSLGALMDATRARVGSSLGTGREARAKLRFDNGAALAAAVERFAAELERLCVESHAPVATPVKVDQLTWDDEPETRQQDALQRARMLEQLAEQSRTSPEMHRGPILGGLAKTRRPKDGGGTWSRSSVPPAMERPTVVPDQDGLGTDQDRTVAMKRPTAALDEDGLGTDRDRTVAAPAMKRTGRTSTIRPKAPTAQSPACFPKPQPSLLPCFEDDVTHGGAPGEASDASLPLVLEPSLASEPAERPTVPERAPSVRPVSLPGRDALVPEPLVPEPLEVEPVDAHPKLADDVDVFAAPAAPEAVVARRSTQLWPLIVLAVALACASGLALVLVLGAR